MYPLFTINKIIHKHNTRYYTKIIVLALDLIIIEYSMIWMKKRGK